MISKKINLTIIIPTYNSSLYIGKTFDHLVDQTDKRFLVMVVDDNSSDKTREIICRYKDKLDITVIKKPKRIKAGAAASINYAFSQVSTKYWALIDSDAFLNQNWVETIISLLEDRKIVGAPVYAHKPNELIAYLSGLEIESRYKHIKKDWLRHLSTCNIAGWTELIQFIHLNEKLKYAYDHELSFQLKRNGIFFYLTRDTFCHHLNKSGLPGYVSQQYKVAKYHFYLSKQMKAEAKEGDEISPSSLILQPICTFFGILLLFFTPILGITLLCTVIILNMNFVIYGVKRNFFYLPVIILIIFLKNIAWIAGSVEGLLIRKLT